MAMWYPILLSFGEDGFKINIKYRDFFERQSSIRKYITMIELYAFKLWQRISEGTTLMRGRMLF